MLATADLIVAQAPPQPAIDDSLLAQARTRDVVALCQILRCDFAAAMSAFTEPGAEHSVAGRNIVRCFGSLIEALSDAMRIVAVTVCEFHGKNYNRFLNAKSTDRGLANFNRIYHSYRIICEALPKSPLARVPDERWDNLHTCLDIRNRIVHPHSSTDLELTPNELMLVAQVAIDFCHDFDVFAQWHGQKQQKLGWEAGGLRKREIPKIGRNEKCPCGSQRKYKNCCAAAQWAA